MHKNHAVRAEALLGNKLHQTPNGSRPVISGSVKLKDAPVIVYALTKLPFKPIRSIQLQPIPEFDVQALVGKPTLPHLSCQDVHALQSNTPFVRIG